MYHFWAVQAVIIQEKGGILIRDFSNRLSEDTDSMPLIAQASSFKRQVLIFL